MNARRKNLKRQQKVRQMQAGALALVFVGVLWFQFGDAIFADKKKDYEKPSTGAVVSQKSQPRRSKAEPVELPFLEVDAIAATDPFGVAVEENSPAEPVRTVVVPEYRLTLNAIYRTSDGWAALINERVVRAGDRLPSGTLIVDVTADGVEIDRQASVYSSQPPQNE